jgi:hypothetical protein
MFRLAAILVAAPLCMSCATRFFGDPKVPNGVAGCRKICDGYEMDLSGMVAMGEYSDGCICQVRGKPGGTPGAAAVSAAAVGVVLQMQADEESRNQRKPGESPHPGGRIGPHRDLRQPLLERGNPCGATVTGDGILLNQEAGKLECR